MRVHLDFETRATIDLREVGLYVYAQHPATEILCMAYAFDEEEPKIWTPAEPFPQDLKEHISAGGIVVAHNSSFERIMWKHKILQYGAPEMPIEQWRCTMVMAYSMALPGSLEDAANALGLKLGKDLEGRKLMLKMCKPRSYKCLCKGKEKDCLWCGGEPEPIWWDAPEMLERLAQYCKQDVIVERDIEKRVLQLRDSELKLWFLDAKINDRGVYIDKELCDAALKVIDGTHKALNMEMRAIAGIETMETSRLAKWVAERLGKEVKSVNKESILEMLSSWNLPHDVRRALELRQEAGKTSTAKIPKMLEMRGEGGRMRGNLQFYGAGTGRWAARGAQLQNLPGPKLKNVPQAIELIKKTQCHEFINMVYGSPLNVVSDCIRGMISCEGGYTMMSADFSNIEGRVLAWLAGQNNKLDAFRAFDAETGPDLYLLSAKGIFGCSIDEAVEFRQIGKVAELALGYQGGPDAFARMAGNYGLFIGDHHGVIWDNIDANHRGMVLNAWDLRGKRDCAISGMEEKAWKAAEAIKIGWRQSNPNIEKYWYLVEEAAFMAVKDPGTLQKIVGKDMPEIAYKVSGSFLFCRLPSGRSIVYPYPKIKTVQTKWGTKKESVVYKCVNGVTRKWEDKVFYGGLGVENITQAVARDIMAEAMVRVDDAGFSIVNTVHDEIISEVETQFADLEEFIGLMEIHPEWAKNCPIKASGWQGDRYKK